MTGDDEYYGAVMVTVEKAKIEAACRFLWEAADDLTGQLRLPSDEDPPMLHRFYQAEQERNQQMWQLATELMGQSHDRG